jgi:NADPH:quinone reductase-like Zn-dependent oxidoreductase
MTDEEAATLPTAFGTSFTALFGASGAGIKPPYSGRSVPPASSIVILGGSGSMGQMGIQFARLAGFDTIVTTASKVHEDYLKSLGATHVLDRHATADAKTILKIAPDVKLVYDTISKESTRALSVSILAKEGGKLIRTLPYEGADLPSDITVKYIVGIFHSNTNGEGPHFWNAAQKWLEDGVLKPNRTEVFEGIEKVDEALTRQARGVSGKKIVIKFLD